MTRTRTFLAAVVALATTAASFSIVPTASASVAHPVVQTKKIVVRARYGRCTTAHTTDSTKCADMLTPVLHYGGTVTSHTKGTLIFQFTLAKTHCAALAPTASAGSDLAMNLKLKHKKISGAYTYMQYSAENRGANGDILVDYSVTGKFVSSNEIHLVLKGKVTQTFTGTEDCAGVTFTETHNLKTVNF